jgi:hypothetical protein
MQARPDVKPVEEATASVTFDCGNVLVVDTPLPIAVVRVVCAESPKSVSQAHAELPVTTMFDPPAVDAV